VHGFVVVRVIVVGMIVMEAVAGIAVED
jgi:hypothetical protein